MKFEDLKHLRYIEFTGMDEPNINSLILYFDRCQVSKVREDIVIANNVIKDSYPIEVDLTHPVIKIEFESYINYSVTNESFTDGSIRV